MKIVMITNLYPPFIRGGAEIAAARIAEGLSSHLQHVVIITTMPFSSIDSLCIHRSRENNATVYRFYPLNLFHYMHLGTRHFLVRFVWRIFDIFNVHAIWQTASVLMKEKPDVVVTHNLTGIGMLHPILVRCMGIRHIHLAHDVQLVAPSGVILLGKERSLLQRAYVVMGYTVLMRLIFSRVRLVISPSRFLLDFYDRYGFFRSSNKIVLPNPVPQTSRVRRCRTEGTLQLLYVGSVSRAKGVALLIRALHDVPAASIALTIVGIGEELHQYSMEASGDQRIVFRGWVGASELEKILVVSDILVAPSMLYDNSPTVVFEALAHGVPVLTSDLGGAQEVIQEDQNGWVVPAGDQDALSSIIFDLSRDRGRVERAALGTIPSIAGYSRDSYIEKFLTACQNDIP